MARSQALEYGRAFPTDIEPSGSPAAFLPGLQEALLDIPQWLIGCAQFRMRIPTDFCPDKEIAWYAGPGIEGYLGSHGHWVLKEDDGYYLWEKDHG